MAGINKAILIGNLGSDPEVRYTPSGVAVANFNIATSEEWNDKDTGEKKNAPNGIALWPGESSVKFAGSIFPKGNKFTLRGESRLTPGRIRRGTKDTLPK